MRTIMIALVLVLALAAAPAIVGAEPPPLHPLSPAIVSRMDSLTAAATRYRGLALQHPVTMGQVTPTELRERIQELVDRDLPATVLSPIDRCLTDFGLLPANYDLAGDFPELLTSQVAGFYDPKQKILVLTDRPGGLLGPEVAKQFGPALAARVEEMAIVHELTHAIQDQHFPLLGLIGGSHEPLADSLTGGSALCEGDATLVMYSYLMGIAVERLPMIGQALAGAASDPDRRAEMLTPFPGIPGADQLAGTPAYMRETLVFPYLQGFVFALAVRQAGGHKLLDYAFSQDTPSSSEQLMHPEKWLEQRDEPVVIQIEQAVTPLMQPGGPLAGYEITARGSHGELGVNLWLTERLGQDAWRRAQIASQGWGGDAFVYLESKTGPAVITWITEWDSPSDADEFTSEVSQAAADWKVDRPSSTRVTLIRGAGTAAAEALPAWLASAPAERRPGRTIDLAALGIGPADLPQPLTQEEMMQLLTSPLMQAVGQGLGQGMGGAGDEGGDSPAR